MIRVQDYEGLLNQAASKLNRRFRIGWEESKGIAYETFCKALNSYDSSKAQFSTYFCTYMEGVANKMGRAKQCQKNRGYCQNRDMDRTTTREDFTKALILAEERARLSETAQVILNWMLSFEWHKPGSDLKPKLKTTIRQFRGRIGASRIQKAWAELETWWRSSGVVLA